MVLKGLMCAKIPHTSQYRIDFVFTPKSAYNIYM